MTEPAESAPEDAPRRPWWVAALVQIAVMAVVLGVIGQLFLDGWTDLSSGLGAFASGTLVSRSPWAQRVQQRRSTSPSRWAAGRPEERWH